MLTAAGGPRALSAVAVAVAAACGDPSVDISLSIPEAYRARVASLRVRVLTVPSPDTLSCDHLAFQGAGDAVIAANQVVDVAQRPRGGPLAGIPRLGDKLIWVEGISALGVPVVSACGPLGAIDDDVAVALAAEPNAVVASDAPDIGGGLPARVTLAVTDTDGALLPAIEVRWTVAGPRGETTAGSAVTGDQGRALIQPDIPLDPGPAVLDVRVRWARQPLPRISGFTPGRLLVDDPLPGPGTDDGAAPTDALYRVGRVGPGGEVGLVALGPATGEPAGRQALIAWYEPDAGTFQRAVTPAIPGVTSLGLFRGAARDRAVASAPTWVEVLPDGTLPAIASPGVVARRIASIGPCQDPPAGGDVLLVQGDDGGLVALTPAGVVPSPFAEIAPADAALVASGCVAGIDAAPRRAVVLAPDAGDLRLLADMGDGGVRVGQLATFPFGLGFTPHTPDEPAALLATAISLDGISIARRRLIPVNEALVDTEVVTQDSSIAVVRAAQGGDVDGDGLVDVVTLLDFGLDPEQGRRSLVQVTLGAQHAGRRIAGAHIEARVIDPALLLADFDGDGADDIAIADRSSVRIYAMGPR